MDLPLGTGEVNIGVGSLATSKRPANIAVKPLMQHYADERREDLSSRESCGRRRRRCSRWAGRCPTWPAELGLIGDAAACVNPLNGEGIDYGLESGRMVAEVLAEGHDLERIWPALLSDQYAETSRSPAGSRAGDRPGCCRRWASRMRPDWLMTLALRWMGNLVTDEDRDRAARVWRWAGGAPWRATTVRRSADSRLTGGAASAAGGGVRRDRPRRQILLSRLAPHVSREGLWTLPAAGSTTARTADAVVREAHEETGLPCDRGDGADVLAAPARHLAQGPPGRRALAADRLRGLGPARLAAAAGAGGRRLDGGGGLAAGRRVDDGSVPTVAGQGGAGRYRPHGCSGSRRTHLVVRDDAVLLTRNSPRGPHPGLWNLPGGGIEHGEAPADAVVREVAEETGLECTVGDIVIVDNANLRGTAPSGRDEKLHSVGIVYAATVPPGAEPRVVEVDGTADGAAWVPLADVESGATPVFERCDPALAARLQMNETVFTYAAPALKFGAGASARWATTWRRSEPGGCCW